jgi:quercetin dioxygenase-like cupin family protein
MAHDTTPDSAASEKALRTFGPEPRLVRQWEATRFLWGDPESGQIADLVYGRGERISAVCFMLGPGHWFGASPTWKPLYDQHRFYFVVRGRLAIHDPESGEVAVAGPGQAITWRGSRYHFGYNVGSDDVLVLDWFAPPDRGLDVPEIATMPDKRELGEVRGGSYEFLGSWPDRHAEMLAQRRAAGGVVVVDESTALQLMHGTSRPQLVSILASSDSLTAGTFRLRGASHTEGERHPGDEVVYSLSGRMHVHLPELGQWHELNELDCLFIPAGVLHEYWSYGADPATAVFCVAPAYR